MAYDLNTKLSAHYTLKNLTQTSQPVSAPNMPTTTDHFNNLKLLADALEMLDAKIGPFNIVSGFRTKELQNLLKSAGEPVATGTSYHEVGLGTDIYPTTMKIAEYFGLILADPELSKRFVEIAIKPSQNTIHLSVRAPGNTKAQKITNLTSKGYIQLTKDQIMSYVAPFLDSTGLSTVASSAGGSTPLLIGAGIAAALAFMLV